MKYNKFFLFLIIIIFCNIYGYAFGKVVICVDMNVILFSFYYNITYSVIVVIQMLCLKADYVYSKIK